VATLQLNGIQDVVYSTLSELGEGKWTDLSAAIQRYVVLSKITKQSRIVIGSGRDIQFDLLMDDNNSARFVGLFENDRVDVPNGLIQGSIPFRNLTANYAFERREILANRGKRQIVDLMKVRRHMAMMAIARKMEDAFWRVPSSTNETDPYGVPYWIVKNATAGFTGTVPSGYTTVAGINPTTYPRWRNYAAPYTAVTKEDLIAAWWKASTLTDFEPPVQGPTFNTGDMYGYYTTYTVYAGLKTLLESQNEDLGYDLDSMQGRPVFGGVPVTWVPQLDDDTTNPVYGINWGEFKTAILGNEWMLETQIPIQPGQHTVAAVHIDASFNYLTRNRRRHFVLSNGTSLPA